MEHLSGYGAYQLYLAIRTHFNSDSYDFFKFGGKTNATKHSYMKRRDKQFFEALAKRYNFQELKDLYVSNFIEGRHYPVNLVEEEAHSTFFEYCRKRDALGYVFGDELGKVFVKGVKESISVNRGEYPRILLLYMQHEIGLETLVLFNEYLPFIPMFDKALGKQDILWSVIRQQMLKFKPFMKYDAEKIKGILKRKVSEELNDKD
jgi:hypothetical protein